MDKAIADYTKSIVLKPKIAESYYTRGEAWLRIRKWEEAQQDLTAAILQGVDIAEGISQHTRPCCMPLRKNGCQIAGRYCESTNATASTS